MADTQPARFKSTCLEAGTIAAFVDGTLDPASRAPVLEHLASCSDCSELVAEVLHTDAELPVPKPEPALAPVPKDDRPRRKVLSMRRPLLAAVGGVIAIAASLVLVVFNRGAAIDPLVAIVGNERLILPRPTGGFHYGPLRAPLRGSSETTRLQLAAEVARLRQEASEGNGRAADVHAYGVGRLVAGDASGAIDSLQTAVNAKPDLAAYVADLGAAYLSRFIDRGDVADAAAALERLDGATTLSPSLAEAWFNKALLLARMNRPADALAAWRTYLTLPDHEGWRDEAIRNRDVLPGR